MVGLAKARPNNFASGSCNHNGGVLTSEDGGLKLSIPKGAIKGLVKFYIATSFYGPFVLPSRCDVISSYYWIGVSESYHFYKPVQVEFEHFAVVTACDPSHYQLLSCEDDDDSYTMQPVDYDLSFTQQGDVSLCTFQTQHFCSYCLSRGCKHATIDRIGAFYLKPENFQYLEQFTVEIWFSFTISCCLKRNEELYTKRNMILDNDCSCSFDVSSDKCSTSYFALGYAKNVNGWSVNHLRFKEIPTKEVDFYNYFISVDDLTTNEEKSLFPPRFILNVAKKPECKTDLDINVLVTLYKKEGKRKSLISAPFKLCVSKSVTMKDSNTTILKEKKSLSLVDHRCSENEPPLQDLIKYSTKISFYWEQMALQLGIPKHEVSTIDLNHNYIEKKCLSMFSTWLSKTAHPCWCHFVQALYAVGLCGVAEEAKVHLKRDSISVPSIESSEENLKNNLVRYLRDVPDCNMNYFITRLLPKERAVNIIKDIRFSDGSKEDKVKKMCKAFLNEKDPSWTKVHVALKQADCGDLADIVEACFL